MGLSAHGFVISIESRGPRGPWVSTTQKFSVDNSLAQGALEYERPWAREFDPYGVGNSASCSTLEMA